LRVRAQVRDGSGSVLRETVVSVFGNAVPGARTFFVAAAPQKRRELPAQGPDLDLISPGSGARSQQGP